MQGIMKFLGVVRYHGKPHPSIYESCLEALRSADGTRILAVGNSLEHDIAGAAAAGLDSAMIAGGVHADALAIRHGELPDVDRIEALCSSSGVFPTFVVPVFAW